MMLLPVHQCALPLLSAGPRYPTPREWAGKKASGTTTRCCDEVANRGDVHFLGRVTPSNVGISIPRMQRQLVVEAIGLKLSVEFDVVSSDVVAVAQVEGMADLTTIRNYVAESVSAVLDMAAVLEGVPLSLEMRYNGKRKEVWNEWHV